MVKRSNLFAIAMGIFVCFLFPHPSRAGTWYVDSSVSQSGDGTTWGTAFRTISEGVDAAADGDTVMAADGEYAGEENGNVDFGGKAITLRSQNGAATCIIDREGAGRGFYFRSGEGPDSVIDGFTIANAYAFFWYPDEYDERGGGIVCDHSSPTITNCVFSENSAYMDGGGIYCLASGAAISDCKIVGNVSEEASGGGIACVQGSNVTISNCIVSENEASGGEGGIYCRDSTATITNCSVHRNNSSGIAINSSDVTVERCAVASNKGAGIDSRYEGSVIVTNCAIYGNHYGGVRCLSSSPEIVNCTIAANRGFGIRCGDSTPTLFDSIVWGNTEGSVVFEGTSAASIKHSDVEGGFEGEGNINADPLFVALGQWDDAGTPDEEWDDVWVGEDFHLRPGSPCIDAGDNADVPPGTVTDLDGNTRFVDDPDTPDTGNGTPPIVDMGAYEFAPLPPARLYVDADANGANDGTNWVDAFTDLQDALDLAAKSAGVVREVWVAAGTYTPDRETGDREATFQLVTGVAIYGGFAGHETELGQRHPVANETILSGDLNGDDGHGPHWDTAENSYNVVTGDDTDATAVLDGFTISGGNADGPGYDRKQEGGGMYSSRGSPTLTHCTFSGNAAGRGGGMSNYFSSPTLANCVFRDNAAERGGGMFNYNSDVTLTNCTLKGNSALDLGGGMVNLGNRLTLINCRFSGNAAPDGGGLVVSSGDAVLINCTFTGNRASDYGGAISSGMECETSLTNCILWGNTAAEGHEIALGDVHYSSSLTVSYSDIEGGAAEIYVYSGKSPEWRSGNIVVDPAFVAPGHWDDAGTPGDPSDDVWIDGDYRVQAGSPCIDAGDNAAVPPSAITDLEGKPRIRNGTVDMGAYEFWGVPWLRITKDDGVVTLEWGEFGDEQYTVEWTDDLVYGTWQPAPGMPLTDIMWSDVLSGEIMQRFYRVESSGIYTDPVGFIKVLAIEDGFTMASVPLIPGDNRLNGSPGCIGDIIAEALTGGPTAEDADMLYKWDGSTRSYRSAYLVASRGEGYDGRWWDDETGDFSTMTLDVGECFWLLKRPRTAISP